MYETQKINIPIFFLKKPAVFGIRNVEEYRLFLESYCIGKNFDYSYFKIKFAKFLLNENLNEIIYNEVMDYPNWVAIIRFKSSVNDILTLEILERELENFINANCDDEKISGIFV